MKKDILAKAMRLADKSTVKPHKIVVAAPKQLIKKPVADILSERIYTRISKSEMRRLQEHVDHTKPISMLLRQLLCDYLDKNHHEKPRKKK